MTLSKLGIRLGTDDPNKPAELKFTDYSINKFQSKFKEGQSYKRTKIINSGIKGLILSQGIKTLKKYFIQRFWFDGKPNNWTIGEFRMGIFGIKECQTKVIEIMKTPDQPMIHPVNDS